MTNILEPLAGVIVGLILAPLFFMVVGMLGYNRTQKKQQAKINEIRENHSKEIQNIKREYEKKHEKYMKLRTKLVRYIDKVYDKQKAKGAEE